MTFKPSLVSRINSIIIAISAAISAVVYTKLALRERREAHVYYLTGFVLSNLSQLAYLSVGWRLDFLLLFVSLGMLVLTAIISAITLAWLGLRLFGSKMAFWKNVM